jgi:hypothetical protein
MQVKRRKKSLNPADSVAKHRVKSNHDPREKLCPLLLVVHPNAVGLVHASFQFQRGAGLAHAGTSNFRMPRCGKYLRLLGGFEVRGEKLSPACGGDRFSTLLSTGCQCHSRRAKAAVLRFVQSHQVYSAQAVALAPTELARPAETPGNGNGNAVKHLERWLQTVMSFRSSSTSRLG